MEFGTPLPNLMEKLKNVDGSEKKLPEWATANKATLIVFSCNHCPYAKAWEDRILRIGKDFGPKGVTIVMINSNDPSTEKDDSFAEMQKRAKQKKYPFAYVVDSTSNVARAFGASRTPEAFLFDAERKLVYHGAIDDNSDAPAVKERYLEKALDEILLGKKVSTKETKFIGCTIKFRS